MVDMPGEAYSPAARLEGAVLGSPLYGDLLDDLEDISRSIGDDTLGSLDFPDYQSTGPSSQRSVVLGQSQQPFTSAVGNGLDQWSSNGVRDP